MEKPGLICFEQAFSWRNTILALREDMKSFKWKWTVPWTCQFNEAEFSGKSTVASVNQEKPCLLWKVFCCWLY
jgi:hypothetical protein